MGLYSYDHRNCTVRSFNAIVKITTEMSAQRPRGDPRLPAEASEYRDIINRATKSSDLCWFAPRPHGHTKYKLSIVMKILQQYGVARCHAKASQGCARMIL